MGLLKTAALLTGGAIAGYLASQAQERTKTTSTEVQQRPGTSHALLSSTETTVAKFFDSALGKPLQPYALKAVKFAATVKQGMNEREKQLKTKFDAHVEDVRPGSLDGWDQEPTLRPVASTPEVLLVEAEAAGEPDQEALTRRKERDEQLGKDFFA